MEKEGIEKKKKILTTHEKAMLALAIGLVVSTFLPWLSVRLLWVSVDVIGIEGGDGLLVLILGGILCVIVFFSESHTIKKRSSLVIGILCGLICLADFGGLSEAISEYNTSEYLQATFGIGLYLAFIISIGLIFLGVIQESSAPIQKQISVTQRFCIICGTSIVGLKFCSQCGTEVSNKSI